MLDLAALNALRAGVHDHKIGGGAYLGIELLLARRVGANGEHQHRAA